MFYPIIVSSLSFYFLDFNDSSAENFFTWMGILCLLAFSGGSFGFMYSCLFDNEDVAL
jgi:hypothetical protein